MAATRGGAGASLPRPTLAEVLACLGTLDTAALRAEWRRLHGVPAPSCLSPDLLRRGLAYRLQERALGGLAPTHRRQLASLASSAGTAPLPDTQPIRLRPGTTLLREWNGSSHSVQVLAQGFEYQGRHYASLTQVARAITGAHWSGPRFFGLRRSSGGSTSASDDGSTPHIAAADNAGA